MPPTVLIVVALQEVGLFVFDPSCQHLQVVCIVVEHSGTLISKLERLEMAIQQDGVHLVSPFFGVDCAIRQGLV